MRREYSRQIFEKPSNIKFHKNPSSGTRDFSHENAQTDGHDEAVSHFTQLRERA